ncbi:MAG TPA: phosphoribosylaminoimidazolesuccinocarboxamide synthase [Spirochaetia bacterium]|nr:phosphoribosylaminoimidazolesuccinocarboxamide synthase [Spirochaetia bacterium]
MQRRELLYEGKAKRVYATGEAGRYLVEFKDDATAFNGAKRGTIVQKGEVNCQVSAALFELLTAQGVANHFVSLAGPREMVVKALKIVPVEVVIRNVVAGSMAKRFGLEEGRKLSEPLLEWYYKDDALGDPLVCSSHLYLLGAATEDQLAAMRSSALDVNAILTGYFAGRGIELVDFKLEYGTDADGRLLLGDEISPDTCRFWDLATRDKLDKDRFRRDLGDVEEAYREVYRRVTGHEL